jgi:hypothetical protein
VNQLNGFRIERVECVDRKVTNAMSFCPLPATLSVLLVLTVSFTCLLLEMLCVEISER